MDANQSVEGLGDKADWVHLLEESQAHYEAAIALDTISSNLKKGKPVDLAQLRAIADKAMKSNIDMRPISTVEAKETMFVPTGWEALDREIVGFPEVGLITVIGTPGSGKTSWALRLMASFLKAHPKKKTVFFSIEMVAEELKKRLLEVDPKITKESMERFIVNDSILDENEIISKASVVENLGLVVIDFADLMITGEAEEKKYRAMYRTLATGAKILRCPVVLLAQPSGSYQGGVPRPQHIRYTRLAEAVSWMVAAIWNPFTSYHSANSDDLPAIEGHSYTIFWKIRGGFKLHLNDSPGAIAIPWRGERGWHPTKGRWVSMERETI